MIFFYISLLSLPLVFLTIYRKTNKGLKKYLGSYFIVEKYKSISINVLNLKILELLLIRILVALIIIFLLYMHQKYKLEDRTISDNPYSIEAKTLINVKPIFENHHKVLDQYNEDIFFIQSFVNNYNKCTKKVKIIYAPISTSFVDDEYFYIIFPSFNQNLEVFSKFSKNFYLSNLEFNNLTIKNSNLIIRAYFPAQIIDSKCISYLNNGACLAYIVDDKFLFFTSSLGSIWGDLGSSAYFIDIIDSFLYSVEAKTNLSKNNNLGAELVSTLPKFDFVKIILIFLVLEAVFFFFRKRNKFLLLLLISSNIYSSPFKFIVLNYDGQSYKNTLYKSKVFIEERTSIKFDNEFYTDLKLNDIKITLPYLWIFGCDKHITKNNELVSFLKDFINRGGIIFSDSCGTAYDFTYNYSIEQLAYEVLNAKSLDTIDYEKAILKSFYILDRVDLKGISISNTTMRIPFYISRNNLINRINSGDNEANKIVLNAVMYMLSGNYKSDQVHTRHILERIKNRELSR